MSMLMPRIGQWYLQRDTGRMFEVVSADEHDGIELQDYEGNLDEIDFDGWHAQDLAEIDQPEDVLGIFDLAEPDEADGSDEAELEDGWSFRPTRLIEEEAWQRAADQGPGDL